MSQSQSQNQSSSVKPPRWFQQYAAEQGKYDEYLDASGNIRPHWQGISEKLESIPVESWRRKKEQLDKLIHEYGITYNLYSDEGSEKNPWSMDMMPHCLPEAEMTAIEGMLSQRAFLLNLVLQDVYGRQSLLNSAKLDPYLIFANPHYLRPCHGLLSSRKRHIHVYAADLIRKADGSWQVLSDRVESAGGLGYTLENRALMSRAFPIIMAESGVKSLQPFSHEFSSYIESLAPSYVDRPNIALFSSGPYQETYFEQSFLSRNLGFNLVEGADLMVRNNHLYMKTVKGVKSIDVLLRRVNSGWCDPLELNNDSLLGVPGLVNTIRKGNLAVANALGSGFAETTALPSILPWLSNNFLGESLEMPSVYTWWCGVPENLTYVIENIENLVVKSTFRSGTTPSYNGSLLSKQQKEDLINRIKSNPKAFCAQDAIIQSTMPIVKNRKLESRQAVMRVMMIPSDNDSGWKIMPGGLVRYSEDGASQISVSMQKGAGSKDLWVLGDASKKPEEPIKLQTSKSRRTGHYEEDLPSRAADNLYWLGRYLERAELLARLLRTVSGMLISQAGTYSLKAAQPFIDALPMLPERKFSLEPDQHALSIDETERRMLHAIYNKPSGESLASNIANIERAASTVKERLSADSWHRLLTVCDAMKKDQDSQSSLYDDEVIISLDTTLDSLTGFIGNLMENMTRSLGWYYLQIGRRLERAFAIARLMKSVVENDSIDNESTLENLLIWGDSSITYRRIYMNTMSAENVLDILCFDETNPRSLAYQAQEIKTLFDKLPHHLMERKHPMDISALSFYSRVALCEPSQLTEKFRSGKKKSVIKFFDEVIQDLVSLSHELEQTYFAHTESASDDVKSV